METTARENELVVDAVGRDRAIPLVDTALAVLDVSIAQDFVHRVAEGHLFARKLAVLERVHRIERVERNVILVALLLRAALETRRKEGCRVRRDFAAEEVERERVPEVQVLLHRREIDHAELPDGVTILDPV